MHVLSTLLADNAYHYVFCFSCRERMPAGNPVFSDRMICATSGRTDKRVDACRGDSGGPVVREVSFISSLLIRTVYNLLMKYPQ